QLSNRMWGRAVRTPAQLASLVAQDLGNQLRDSPEFDLNGYLHQHYGTGYQPFEVVLAGERRISRVFTNHPGMVPLMLGRDARRRLAGFDPEAGRTDVFGQHIHMAEYADI